MPPAIVQHLEHARGCTLPTDHPLSVPCLPRRPWWLAAWWLFILAAVVLVAYGLTVTAAVRGQLDDPAEPPAIVVTPYPTPSPSWRSPR